MILSKKLKQNAPLMARLLEKIGVSVEAHCDYCLDKDYITMNFNHPIIHSGVNPDINGYFGSSRTYSLRLKGKF